jgi:glutaredoxin-like protein NrdH
MTVVYTKPNCVQCDQTKKLLDKNGVEYTTVDITKDEAAFNMLIEKGFQAAPVVFSGDDSWAGFRPDKINSIES